MQIEELNVAMDTYEFIYEYQDKFWAGELYATSHLDAEERLKAIVRDPNCYVFGKMNG